MRLEDGPKEFVGYLLSLAKEGQEDRETLLAPSPAFCSPPLRENNGVGSLCSGPHRQPGFGLPDHLLEGRKISLFAENPPPSHGPVQHVVGLASAGDSQSS